MAITLLTDFGNRDYFVGSMKGVIIGINPAVRIIDITHEIEPQNILSGGVILSAVYRDFPEQTIFVAVVDPGVGSGRRAILVETRHQYFIAPDNGLLSFVFRNEAPFRVIEILNDAYFRTPVSQTFHGRDIFAPVAAWLSTGVAPDKFGVEITDFLELSFPEPRKASRTLIKAEVIHIDHFGNLITNLAKEDLAEGFSLSIKGRVIDRFYEHYSASTDEIPFAIAGSAGFIEICVFRGSAQKLFECETGERIEVRFS